MAQSYQATPTLQANIAGTTTTVNQRDWLNTRISPFLKKAIIESLDSEAEYPLQWLGEHLIQQSILFEGNPDSTNIQERFRYKHDVKLPTTLAQNSEPSRPQASPAPQQTPTPQPIPQGDEPARATSEAAPVPAQVDTNATATSNATEMESDMIAAPTVNVNGSAETTSDAPAQDTEMSNAP